MKAQIQLILVGILRFYQNSIIITFTIIIKKFKIDKFPQNKSYNSDQNEDYLNETGIKKILRKLILILRKIMSYLGKIF